MLKPIEIPSLSALPGIRHGFFTRDGGVSSGIYRSLNCGLGSNDNQADVLENRRRVAGHLQALHGQVVTLFQEHGVTARIVSEPCARDAMPKADAVVTATPGLAVAVLTADCAPILFADPEARVVAAAHAGWRGAVSGIIESAVAEMERAGATRKNIVAAIGPCIHKEAYEVGADFEAGVVALDSSFSRFFSRSGAHAKPHFDLPGFVDAKLRALGLAAIDSSGVCTHQNESLLFSYRRTTERQEPDYGRQISAIVVT